MTDKTLKDQNVELSLQEKMENTLQKSLQVNTKINIDPIGIEKYDLTKYAGSKRKLLVCQNDWVWSGILTEEDDDCYYLRDAYIVSVWGTTSGIREICAGPTKETRLDPIDGLVTLFKHYVEVIEDVDDEVWDQYGLNLTEEEEKEPYGSKKIHSVTKFENSQNKIVMYKCGWTDVGYFSYKKDKNETILDSSFFLQEWGTTRGLGELCNGPTESTKLDINRGTIRASKKFVLGFYDVDDFAWDNFRLSIL
jgi:hypothetical protein